MPSRRHRSTSDFSVQDVQESGSSSGSVRIDDSPLLTGTGEFVSSDGLLAESVIEAETENITMVSAASFRGQPTQCIDKPVGIFDDARSPPCAGFCAFLLSLVVHLSSGYSVYNYIYETGLPELEGVLRPLSRESGLALAAWRIVYSIIGWRYQLDGSSMAAVNALSTGPALFLLITFYKAPLEECLAAAFADSVILWATWQALIQPWPTMDMFREVIASDWLTRSITILYASSINFLVLFFTFQNFAPMLVLNFFGGHQTISTAYALDYTVILPVALAFGVAIDLLVFASSVDIGLRPADRFLIDFQPATATLGETAYWNFFGYTVQAKTAMARTLLAMLASGIGTFSMLEFGLQTTDTAGTLAYSAIWVLASFLSGSAMSIVSRR